MWEASVSVPQLESCFLSSAVSAWSADVCYSNQRSTCSSALALLLLSEHICTCCSHFRRVKARVISWCFLFVMILSLLVYSQFRQWHCRRKVICRVAESSLPEHIRYGEVIPSYLSDSDALFSQKAQKRLRSWFTALHDLWYKPIYSIIYMISHY